MGAPPALTGHAACYCLPTHIRSHPSGTSGNQSESNHQRCLSRGDIVAEAWGARDRAAELLLDLPRARRVQHDGEALAHHRRPRARGPRRLVEVLRVRELVPHLRRRLANQPGDPDVKAAEGREEEQQHVAALRGRKRVVLLNLSLDARLGVAKGDARAPLGLIVCVSAHK